MTPFTLQEISASEMGLKDEQLEEIRSFARKNPAIEEVILYGSRAKGNYRPGSDVDLVLVGKGLKLTDQLSFWNDLDDSYQPYFFDVAILHQIQNDSLLEHIKRVGKRIYRSTN
ncbi:nucleotidyltransferase domain-containing protein [Algoriphagus sp.]|uniref:nucleotidyltransferase domain-containing protein n=1 Tax=Algoriphagus sp. TaxID=1872435 RepID=UPI00391B58CF